MSESKVAKSSTWIVLIVIGVVLPNILIYSGMFPRWVARTLAVGIVCVAMTIFFTWKGLGSESRIIVPNSPYNASRYEASRPKIILAIRAFFLVLALFCLFYIVVPLSADVVGLARGQKPIQITETITAKSNSLFGMLVQWVNLTDSDGQDGLWYSWEPLHVHETYAFTILPRSRLIVDFHDVTE
jgi:membrane protease YdiL (CAAX protease family)